MCSGTTSQHKNVCWVIKGVKQRCVLRVSLFNVSLECPCAMEDGLQQVPPDQTSYHFAKPPPPAADAAGHADDAWGDAFDAFAEIQNAELDCEVAAVRQVRQAPAGA